MTNCSSQGNQTISSSPDEVNPIPSAPEKKTIFNSTSKSNSTIWPVVQRELRAGARKALNYWMRVATAAVGILIFYYATRMSSTAPSMMGAQIFVSLHVLLVLLILVTVPGMTADCIAREKREGTLGLLFMTHLSAQGIVIGKCLVQALRAWALWLSVLPILAVPFFLGGITWIDVSNSIVIQLCVAFLALGAGLIIASTTQIRVLVILLAEITAGIFLCCFAFLLGKFLVTGFAGEPLLLTMLRGLHLLTNGVSVYGRGAYGGTSTDLLWIYSKTLVLVLLMANLCISLTAWHIRQTWRDKAPSVRRDWWVKRFCTELAQGAFRRKMQRTLDWNPIAFLQQYSWKNRLSKWGLCLLFVALQCAFCDELADLGFMLRIQSWLLLVLAAMFTFVGVSSFLSEKQNGALELILVTPLEVNQIIFGRSWGLWKQFLPALLSLVLFQIAVFGIALESRPSWYGDNWLSQLFVVDLIILMAFISLPIFATYAALRVKYLLGAAFLTWVGLFLGLAFGYLFAGLLHDGGFYRRDEPFVIVSGMAMSYAGFIALTVFLLRHSLSRRIYSF